MENDNDDSPFEYEDLQLPACSVRTLQLIAEEREIFRTGIAACFSGFVPEHVLARAISQLAIEDTTETARALSRHMAAPRPNLRGLILSLN
jgi:hypothetical protein